MSEKRCGNCYYYSFDDMEMWCIYTTPSQKIFDESFAEDCEYFESPTEWFLDD